MNEADLKLLAEVFREARDLASDCECEADFDEMGDPIHPDGSSLQRALDNFDIRASFRVPNL